MAGASRLLFVAALTVAPAILASSAHAQVAIVPLAVGDLPPAIAIPLDCFNGILGRRLIRRVAELEVTPVAQRIPAAAIELASEWVAMAERCPDEPDHTWALVYAGYALNLGGELRSAAEQFLRAQQHARSRSEAVESDREQQLRALESEAAMQRGRVLERLFEFDEALASYHSIIDDPVFSQSDQPQLQEAQLDALGCALALLHHLRRQQEFDLLLRRVRRAVDTSRWPTNVGVARLRRDVLATGVFVRATVTAERGQRGLAIREFERLVADFGETTGAAARRLEARWRIFELRVDSGAHTTRAIRMSLLRDVLDAAADPIPNTIGVREWFAGQARFRMIDEQVADLVAHLRRSRTMTRAVLERGIELANAVAAAHAAELSDAPPFWMIRGIARSADAYALLVRALDASQPATQTAEWQRAARAQLACHAVVLDRLALSHAHLTEMDTEWFVTSINRLALTPPEDIRACGEQLPSAAGAFPVVPLDAPPTAPLGLRLPLTDPDHVIPDLVDVPR